MAQIESKPVILLVDDNRTLTNLLALLISSQLDASVLKASSCEAARRLVEKTRPDVLVADLKLPDGDGLELAEEVLSSWGDVRVVLMSAELRDDAARRAKSRFVFAAALNKPFDSSEILDALRAALVVPTPTRAGTPPSDGGGRDTVTMDRLAKDLESIAADIRTLMAELSLRADDEPGIRALVAGPLETLLERLFDASAPLRARKGR